jgi:Zn-dependent M28 family amino/carboxypeptidase
LPTIGACELKQRLVAQAAGGGACYRLQITIPFGGLVLRFLSLAAAIGGFLVAPVGFTQGASPTSATSLAPAVEQAARTYITPNALAASVGFLASDALEGRGPATRGDQLARLYLSSELQSMGYQPAFPNGQWQQPLDIVGLSAQMPATWSFQARQGRVDLKWSEDYIASSGLQKESVSVNDAELVFVGYGIQAPEYHWDDFKGASLKGKVLVMLNNDPDWDPKLFAGTRRLYYGRWTYKYESAARQGAAGAIIIHTTPSAGYPWQVIQSSWGGEQFELPAESEARISIKGWTTEAAMRQLLSAAGQNLDKLVQSAKSRSFKPVPLGIRTSIAFTNKLSHVQTANVGGVLRGSDAKLADEVVVLTAHHDHFGIGQPDASGDRIYHGAADNAAGCAQLLTIARSFAALPEHPRRSILILFVAAEERGLLGSTHYAQHPSFPAGRIAADVNFDGGNIFGRARDITSISAGKSSLDAIAQVAVQRQGRQIKPDQFPDRGSYYRSDQFAFAKIGVPALFFAEGTDFVGRPAGWGRQQIEAWEEKQYHQPGDKLDGSWNFDGMIDDAQLGMYSTWLIAQADAMPTWNPGDEFEAARRKALAAVSN